MVPILFGDVKLYRRRVEGDGILCSVMDKTASYFGDHFKCYTLFVDCDAGFTARLSNCSSLSTNGRSHLQQPQGPWQEASRQELHYFED